MIDSRSPTILNVAEKPSVARSLADVFSRIPGSVDRGMRRQAHQIFTQDNVSFVNIFAQGDGRLRTEPCQTHTMITTSVRGHLSTNEFPPAFGWSKVDPIVLFEAPIATTYKEDMEPLKKMIVDLAKNSSAVILWLDCDREGEAIGDEVREVCLQGNPRLQIYRARFSTVMQQEIMKALNSLGRLNEFWVQAVQARIELDLRVGAAFTRFQTLRLQRKFDGFAEQGVISYGPCQFPTLGFVVERWARIQTFVSEDFWFIELSLAISTHDDAHDSNLEDNGIYDQQATAHPIRFMWKRSRLYDKFLASYLYEACLETGEAIVTNLEGRPKSKWRPVPLATVELQKRASRYLRIGSETLMTAAEELYQQGYISYPRTETEKFRPEFNHRPLLEQFVNVNNDLGVYARKLLFEGGFQVPRDGSHDDQAHPPITPCRAVDPNTINDQTQRGVYLLVVKHYLACCSRDAVGTETQISVQMDSEEFTAKGLIIRDMNWLEIYQPWERWSTGQGELPNVEVGSRIAPFSLLLKESCTSPPQPISEVELITLMDRHGIGTDATIAQHITTIQDRNYVTKDSAMRFHPTQLGIALIEGYNSIGYQLNKPDLRRETEAECNHVASGVKTKAEIMAPLIAKMKLCYEITTQDAEKLDDAIARYFSRLGTSNETTDIIHHVFTLCGQCQGSMSLKQERPARGTQNTPRKVLFCPTCRVGHFLPRGIPHPKLLNENGGDSPAICPICNFQIIQISRGDGYDGNGYNLCPKCFSDPPVTYGGSANGDFRCFECQHPTCSLALGTPGGDIAVFACPFCCESSERISRECLNNVVLRKNSRGYVLSCNKFVQGQDRCSYTIWLPKAVRVVTVMAGDENSNDFCTNCSIDGKVVRKVKFAWRPGSVPAYLGNDYTTCILCDVNLRRDLEISLPQRNRVATRPRMQNIGQRQPITTGRGRTSRIQNIGQRQPATAGRGRTSRIQSIGQRQPATAGRGRTSRNTNSQNAGRVTQCYSCGQSGHFANNCPQR